MTSMMILLLWKRTGNELASRVIPSGLLYEPVSDCSGLAAVCMLDLRKQVVPSKYGIQILCVCSFVCFHLSIRNTEHKLLGKTNFNQNKLVNRYDLIFAGGSAV